MSKSFKVAALIAVTAMILAAPVFAQTSNTNSATAGLYKTDVDKATHVHDYTDVSINKWAGFIGGGIDNGFPIQLGFAKKFGGGEEGSGGIGGVRQNADAAIPRGDACPELCSFKTFLQSAAGLTAVRAASFQE